MISMMVLLQLYEIANIANEFARLRKAKRKVEKLGLKPWITNDLLKSIQINTKLAFNNRCST